MRAENGLPPGPGYGGAEALDPGRRQAFMAAFRALYPRADVKQYVDQIDYVAKRVGVDHVGVGSNFNHGAGIDGFSDETDAPNVTRELVARGYREADVAKIWGGNFLRVFSAAVGEGRQAPGRS